MKKIWTFCSVLLLAQLLMLTGCEAPKAVLASPYGGAPLLPQAEFTLGYFPGEIPYANLNYPLPAFAAERTRQRAQISEQEKNELYFLGNALGTAILLFDNYDSAHRVDYLASIRPYLTPEKLSRLEEGGFFSGYGEGRAKYGYACNVYRATANENQSGHVVDVLPGQPEYYLLLIDITFGHEDNASGFLQRYFYKAAWGNLAQLQIFFIKENGHFYIHDWAGAPGGYEYDEE